MTARFQYAKEVSKARGFIVATVTPSFSATLASDAADDDAVTVPGAQVGDLVIGAAPVSATNEGVLAGGQVSAANTVQLGIRNAGPATATGLNVDWNVCVMRIR